VCNQCVITGVNMRISAPESIVMEALWRRAPMTAEEITAEVAAPQGWGEATVKTLLNRLLTKEIIAAEREGRRYSYRPLIARDTYVSAESQTLLDRLFEGRLTSLVCHFSEREQLSPQDIAELKRLIAELEDER
jgi:BlaI family penicillinase repressor